MTEVEQLEQQRDDVRTLLDRREMATRLAKNRDFKLLIMEGFMRDEAARLVQMSSDPVLKEQERTDALNMAQATGHLKRFLQMIFTMASVAEREMPEIDQAIFEARTAENDAELEDEDAGGDPQ